MTARTSTECLDSSMNTNGQEYPPLTYCGEPIEIAPGQDWVICPRCGCGWAPEALQPASGYLRTGDQLRAAGYRPLSPNSRE